ncbi:micronuclear linker histone polyprotein-like [Ambystoma mexicanum]|uniref:micronuclear linker histone polyprotein-like n=1 Tax=Ambystoma mexicanum TaxID=8296 RepID=UPI0037E94AB0
MSAVSIALAPFTKLYESISENLKDHTTMQAMMYTKLIFLEGYITALDQRLKTNTRSSKEQSKEEIPYDQERTSISTQTQSLPISPSTVMPVASEPLTSTKNGARIYDQSEVIHISEETPPRLNRNQSQSNEKESSLRSNGNQTQLNEKDQVYPIFCAQNGTLTEKMDKSDSRPTLQKPKKNQIKKGRPSTLQGSTLVFQFPNDTGTKQSPKTVEDFLADDQLMNISEHLERDPTSSMPTRKEQVEEKAPPSPPSCQLKSPPFRTMEERRNTLHQPSKTNQTNAGHRKVSFSSRTESPSSNQGTPKSEPRHKSREWGRHSSREDLRRALSKKNSKEHLIREKEPLRTVHHKSKTELDHDRSNSTKKIAWSLKIEQRSENRDEIILNRRGVLTLFGSIPALRQIKSEDLKLVDPYHSNRRANTYLYIASKKIQSRIIEEAEELSKFGYMVTGNSTSPGERREIQDNASAKIASTGSTRNKSEDYSYTKKSYEEVANSKRRSERNSSSGKNRDTSSNKNPQKSVNKEPPKKLTPREPQTNNPDSMKAPENPQSKGNLLGIWSWLPKALSKNLNK